MRTPASAGVLARPDRFPGLRSMVMAPGGKQGGEGRPKRDRARRSSDEGRRGGAGERKGNRGRGTSRADGRHGATRGTSNRQDRRPTERSTAEGPGQAREARRPRRDEEAGGFGPYARESRDFEGAQGRPGDAGGRGRSEPVVRKAAREAVARGRAPSPALRLVKGEPTDRGEGPAPDRGEGPAPRPKQARRAPGAARQLAALRPAPTGPRPPRLVDTLEKASRALDRGHEKEALQTLRPLRDQYPTDPDVRELLGIALYRLGRWLPARKELEAFVELTGSAVEHPVLMDCARALGRHTVVDRLWEEVRAASPAPEIMTEGRIVAAGSLADRGRITEAIKVLERGPVNPKRVATHHLRLWYALADLHERAGNLPAARALFRKVSAQDPAFFDVAERLAALS